MKVRYGALKRVIREVAMSPSVFKNNRHVEDPFDQPNLARAMTSLETPFKNAVTMNLVLDERDAYDEQSREFDDAAYQRVEEVAQKATEMMVARVHKAVQASWAEAMKGTGNVEKPAEKKRVA